MAAPLGFRPNILIGVSGSVATIKLKLLVEELLQVAQVRVVCTKASQHFFCKSDIDDKAQLFTDEDEWNSWSKIGDSVLHIELRRWAHIFVIAPTSANTLAKLAFGLSDNLLTCVARAWDYKRDFYVAPAMNTLMWDHPLTQKHLTKLQKFGIKVIPPASKRLACGDTGTGAMAEVSTIVSTLKTRIAEIDWPREAPT